MNCPTKINVQDKIISDWEYNAENNKFKGTFTYSSNGTTYSMLIDIDETDPIKIDTAAIQLNTEIANTLKDMEDFYLVR